MGKRRAAREMALNILYQVDVGKFPVNEAVANMLEESQVDDETREFALRIACGAIDHQGELDKIISELATGWTLERIASVDRNILRLAIYEILYVTEVPNSVAINEAVELAKKYSTAESGKFVNGILGTLVRRIENKDSEKPQKKVPVSKKWPRV